MTIPEPALPEKTKPALITWKMARPEENERPSRQSLSVLASSLL